MVRAMWGGVERAGGTISFRRSHDLQPGKEPRGKGKQRTGTRGGLEYIHEKSNVK